MGNLECQILNSRIKMAKSEGQTHTSRMEWQTDMLGTKNKLIRVGLNSQSMPCAPEATNVKIKYKISTD